MKSDHSEIVIYQTEDGRTKIDVRMEEQTVRKESLMKKAMCKFCTLQIPTNR